MINARAGSRSRKFEPASFHRSGNCRRVPQACYWMVLLAIAIASPAMAQQAASSSSQSTSSTSAPDDSSKLPDNPTPNAADDSTGRQTKRILYVIPNFRSVSVDQVLPPQTPKEKFVLMLQDSFDYSSFLYVGGVAGGPISKNPTLSSAMAQPRTGVIIGTRLRTMLVATSSRKRSQSPRMKILAITPWVAAALSSAACIQSAGSSSPAPT